jgi:transposase
MSNNEIINAALNGLLESRSTMLKLLAEQMSFADGIRQDQAAVQAAITEPWSNGPVEGQVNRLKVIKRSMYGRAGFALLRARIRRKR